MKKHKDRARGRRPSAKAGRKGGRGPGGQLVEPMEPRQLLSTYYVSTAGADTNAGTLAAPFRTIQRAADLAQAGDTVLIRGGTYRETVAPSQSGSPGAPITFAAYNGEQVVVNGADPVSGWTSAGGSIYTAPVPWALGPGADQVLVDGRMITEARWPNTSLDVSHPTSARAADISASNGIATLRDPNLTQPAGYWNGAYIHFFPGQGWVAETGRVISSLPGQLTFSYQDNGPSEHPSAGDNYYLFGKFQGLDAPGEFYHDPTTGQLYVWTPTGDSPAGHLIEVKHRDYAFDLRGVSDIRLDGISIFAATITTDASSARVTIDHLRATYTSHFQIQASGWDQPKDSGIELMGDGDVLEDSIVAYSAGDGVYVGGTNDRVSNVLIHDVDYNGGDSAGVRIVAAYTQVDHDTIYNAGRDGIGQYGWVSHILSNNIHDVMLQGTDGGGIYTVRSNGSGSEIAYNRIYNAVAGGYGAAGIYLDNDSSGYLIHHNLVWNVNAGMKINYSSQDQQIYNNTLDAIDYGIEINQVSDWSGSIVENNIFFRPAQMGAGATAGGNIYPNTDPKVMNRTAADYRLKSGSPAIGQGVPVPSAYGSNRPDIGALAYGSPVFPSGASVPVRSSGAWTPIPLPPPPPPPVSAPSPIPPPAPVPPSPPPTAPDPLPPPLQVTPPRPVPATGPDAVPPPAPALTPAQRRRQHRHQRHAHGPRPHHVVKPEPAPRPRRVHPAHSHPLKPQPKPRQAKPKPTPHPIAHLRLHANPPLRAAA